MAAAVAHAHGWADLMAACLAVKEEEAKYEEEAPVQKWRIYALGGDWEEKEATVSTPSEDET